MLTHPTLHFHVIGYTDIDEELSSLRNVTITGAYEAGDLGRLIKKANARIGLFLHQWPETFSYTLTEAVALGLVPMVPDLGAPAERVRASGFGVVFPHPSDATVVLATIAGLAEGTVAFSKQKATPASYAEPDAIARTVAIFAKNDVSSDNVPPPETRRRVKKKR